MIVWNAGRRFFPLKADADAHRRAYGLVTAAVKVEITGRDDLAALLNGLCAAGEDLSAAGGDPKIAADVPNAADVPEFLRKAWAKLQGGDA